MGVNRSNQKALGIIGRWLWLCTALFLMTGCQQDDETEARGGGIVNVGDDIPEFQLTSIGGEEISSASLKGQIYMLSFFDTGCRDCQQELPVLQRVYDKYGETVTVLNVPRSQKAVEVQDYWSRTGLTMPFYTPCDEKLYYKFATSGIPRTFIVDGEGTVRAVYSDAPLADFATIDGQLRELLKAQATSRGTDTVDMTFRLTIPTRADQDYFQNEHVISHLELFFFDAETKKYATKAVTEDLVRLTDTPDTHYEATYLVSSARVKVGYYNIYAIANYEYTPEHFENEEEFLNMIDSITYKDGIAASIPASGPVMTSDPEALLDVDLVPWAGKSYGLTIDMERVLAKLQIGIARNYFELKNNGEKYADINITNYKLVNLNKQYYLFQHNAKEADSEYIVDPLFTQKTDNIVNALRFKDYYVSWFGNFNTEGFASMPTAGNYGYAYLLENTANSLCQKNGYSPGIVFKAAVSPTVVYLYDPTTRTLLAENRPEYWPNTIYLYQYHFYGSIQAINMAANLALDELEIYSDSQLKAYGIKQCKFNMGVYETYYTYWICHRQNVSQHMSAMEYALVRNNFYKITITGVSGIGDSEIVPDVLRDNYPNSYSDVMIN